MMKYRIVIPCYNEEKNVPLIYNKIVSVLHGRYDFDILFVNDASTDRTLETIKSIREMDSRVHYISLLYNAGQQKAIYAGLKSCTDCNAVTMDADLQHPPELLPEMIDRLEQGSAHIIAGRRQGKQMGFFKNLSSKSFYRLFSLSTGILLQPGISDFRVYGRKALDVLCAISERDPFLRGMIASLRLRVEVVDYRLQKREHGEPSFTFSRSLMMGMKAFLRFSHAPIMFGIFIGCVGVLVSFAEGIQYLYLRLFTDELVPGQAELMVFLALIASIILLQLSFLLRTVMQILETVQNRPAYVIEETTN